MADSHERYVELLKRVGSGETLSEAEMQEFKQLQLEEAKKRGQEDTKKY